MQVSWVFLTRNLTKQLRYPFTRTRNPRRQKPTLQDKQNFPKHPYDLKNFDYLEGIKRISTEQYNLQVLWLNELKDKYEKDDDQCIRLVRLKQEDIMEKICQDEVEVQRMKNLLTLQRSILLKFRRYDEISINVNNSQQLIKRKVEKQGNNATPNEQEILNLYNQYTATLILNDHDKLHSLLSNRHKLFQRGRKSKVEKADKDMGIIIYQIASEIAKSIKQNQVNYNSYIETAFLQTKALLVLGQKLDALKIAASINGPNYIKQHQQQAWILIIQALSYQNEQVPTVKKGLMDKLLKFSPLSEKELSDLSSCGLKANQSEILVNELIKRYRNKQAMDLQGKQLKYYDRLLCLIAENYYLEGKPQEAQRILKELQHQSKGDIAIGTIIQYIRMGMTFDKQQYQTILSIVEQLKERESVKTAEGKLFYNVQTINQDILRVNVNKLAINAYKQMKNAEKGSEVQTENCILQGTIGVYTLREPEITQQEEQFTPRQTWRTHAKARTPYYYFDLHLPELFKVDWQINLSR